MPLPKKLKAGDFAADPARRPGHLLYLPEDTVYSLTAEQYRQLTGEEIPFVPQAIPVQREGTIELQRQLEEALAQVSELQGQLAAAKQEIAQLKMRAAASVEASHAGQ